jgi:hypothetical protein
MPSVLEGASVAAHPKLDHRRAAQANDRVANGERVSLQHTPELAALQADPYQPHDFSAAVSARCASTLSPPENDVARQRELCQGSACGRVADAAAQPYRAAAAGAAPPENVAPAEQPDAVRAASCFVKPPAHDPRSLR